MLGETRDVRTTEQLDWAALAKHLRWRLADQQISGLDLDADMEVSQFPGGHSNLTYLVRFGGAELVLRRPPLGPLPPRAHDMAREFRWLTALHPVFPLAPRPYLLCEDPQVIGSVFYMMERRRGAVVRGDEPLGLAKRPEVRRELSASMVATLVDLHAIDVTRDPIASLGKPAGFLERQVRGWTDRWEAAKLDAVPEMEALAQWLAANLPGDPDVAAVVHGDFKLDNVMLDPLDLTRLTAVFDWEMSALGDPLVDLGILLAYWTPTTSPARGDTPEGVTGRQGYFTREEILEVYERRSGRDVSSIRYYEAFARFKIAVLVQQIFARYTRGQTDDPRFAHFDERVRVLAREGVAVTL